jgi:hypothetical protein
VAQAGARLLRRGSAVGGDPAKVMEAEPDPSRALATIA